MQLINFRKKLLNMLAKSNRKTVKGAVTSEKIAFFINFYTQHRCNTARTNEREESLLIFHNRENFRKNNINKDLNLMITWSNVSRIQTTRNSKAEYHDKISQMSISYEADRNVKRNLTLNIKCLL